MTLLPRSLSGRVALLVAGMILLSTAGLLRIMHAKTSERFIDIQDEIREAEAPADGPETTELRRILGAALAHGGPSALRQTLSESRQAPPVLIVDDDLQPLATSLSLPLDAFELRWETDSLVGLDVEADGDDGALTLSLVLPVEELLTGDDQRTFLLTLPRPEPSGEEFATSVWHLAAAWIALFLVVAIGITLLLLRRALRPIRNLTQAAKQLQRGRSPGDLDPASGSEFTELLHAFEDAASAIAHTERLRRQLIADIAHELRTPVTNLKAQLEALDTGLLTWDAETATVFRSETRGLERLADDFQQLAAADAGSLVIHRQALPADEALHDLLNPLVTSVGGELRLSVEPGLRFLADEDRLRQIFANLVENAARHVEARLELRVSARATPVEASCTVEIRLQDNGPGLPESQLERVFERFYRADPSRTAATGGSGLGLTIARGLIEAMGGQLHLENAADEPQGLVAVVRLPAADNQESETE